MKGFEREKGKEIQIMKISFNRFLFFLGCESVLDFDALELLLTTRTYYAIIKNKSEFNELITSSVVYNSVNMFRITKLPISEKIQIVIELSGEHELSIISTAKRILKKEE